MIEVCFVLLRQQEKNVELLNKMLDWIKTHKMRFIVLVILVFIVPIILVQVAYSLPTFIPSFTSPLSAGDLLGYYAAFIATVGTVFLGAVAVWQNSVIHKKEMAIQEKNEIEKIAAAKPLLKGLDGIFSNRSTIEIKIKIEYNLAKIKKIHSAEIFEVSNRIHCSSGGFPQAAGSEFIAIFYRIDNIQYEYTGNELFLFTIDYTDVSDNVYSSTFSYICHYPTLKIWQCIDGIPYSENERNPNMEKS